MIFTFWVCWKIKQARRNLEKHQPIMLDELHNKQVKLIKSSQGFQFKIHSLSFKMCYYVNAISMIYNHNIFIDRIQKIHWYLVYICTLELMMVYEFSSQLCLKYYLATPRLGIKKCFTLKTILDVNEHIKYSV